MQSDTDGKAAAGQSEEDRDSLFGSPPSSPITGRSPSPALALPSASKSTQNVGTIALPGSHHYSELPVTPLALSLSNALNELPHRPPAPSTTVRHPGIPTSTSTTPSWSRASSAGPTSKPKRKTSKKAKSKESTPRLSPPEIFLPDPSGPVPANFLRNQTALLGTAGLVGGVNPAHLSTHRHTRGTNPSNPIVVEDEEEPPALGRFRQPYIKPVDPSLLPAPSTHDVVAMLIGQKDIFPVLESLLRLIALGSGSQPSPPQSSFRRPPQVSSQNATPISTLPSGPPAKKRKLNSVPAGAADWDVPYPFPPGQGPVSYRTNWERERGKQLITQLVTLIKSAARKAATRLYYQNEQTKKQVIESQRAADAQTQGLIRGSDQSTVRPTTTYGLGGAAEARVETQTQEVLTDASNVNTKTAMAQAPSPYQSVRPSAGNIPAPQPQPSTPFDQLITSLLAATPNQNITQDWSSTAGSSITSEPVADVMGAGNASAGAKTLEQGLVDNWMNVLQTFPMPSEGLSQSQNQRETPVQPSTSTATPNNGDSDFFDFDQTYTTPNYTGATSFDFERLFDATDITTTTTSSSTAGFPDSQPQPDPPTSHDSVRTMFPTSQPDFAIDPSLLAISTPHPSRLSQPSVVSTSSAHAPPSLAASPIPSQSSSGEAEPTTPKSAAWDLSMPEVFSGFIGDATADKGLVTGHGYHPAGFAGQGGVDDYINVLYGAQSQDKGKNTDTPKLDKGKGRDIHDSIPGPQLLFPSPSQTEVVNAPVISCTPTSSAEASKANDKPLNKVDIMRRAEERKKQLMDEISSVRTQLWETTIEQGVLSHMSKLCNHTT